MENNKAVTKIGQQGGGEGTFDGDPKEEEHGVKSQP